MLSDHDEERGVPVPGFTFLGPEENYDPLTSFEPICYLVSSPQVIVVNSASPYRKLSDFIDEARAKPGELSLASVGPATTQHIGFEMLRHLAKIDVNYVPYPGEPLPSRHCWAGT